MNRDSWWAMPGSAQLVDLVRRHLRSGKSVAMPQPEFFPSGLAECVRSAVQEDGLLAWHDLQHEAAEEADDPPRMVSGLFGEADPATRPVDAEELVHSPWFKNALIHVDLSCAEERCVRKWSRFVKEWEQSARGVSVDARSLFFLRFRPTAEIEMNDDVALSVLNSESFLGSLDMETFVHLLAAGQEATHLGTRLQSALVAELAGFDRELAEYLSAYSVDDLTEPDELLRSFAERRGWVGARSRARWEDGTAGYVDGVLSEHSAWLAAQGKNDSIRRRVWSAELRVLFPEIERWRFEFVQRHRHRFHTEMGLEEMELGTLIRELKRHRILLEDDQWTMINLLRTARNHLAHITPLPPTIIPRLVHSLHPHGAQPPG